jgi:hypothetical protein
MISVRAFFKKTSYSRAISGDTTSIISRFSSQNSMTWEKGLRPRMPRPKRSMRFAGPHSFNLAGGRRVVQEKRTLSREEDGGTRARPMLGKPMGQLLTVIFPHFKSGRRSRSEPYVPLGHK